jgi:hypothetical protein
MLKAAAISCCSSVFTLAKTMLGFFSAAASKVGAKLRQGAHHGAQKSTITVALLVIVD